VGDGKSGCREMRCANGKKDGSAADSSPLFSSSFSSKWGDSEKSYDSKIFAPGLDRTDTTTFGKGLRKGPAHNRHRHHSRPTPNPHSFSNAHRHPVTRKEPIEVPFG